MKMLAVEKQFVNREAKGRANFERLRPQLDRYFNAGQGPVLELGCGMGTLSALVAETYNTQVCGTDADSDQVALAQEHYSERNGLTFQVEDATALSFPDEHFDLVISQFVFHHIPNWECACAEIARVLKPGGVVLWSDLTVAQPVRSLFALARNWVGLYTFDAVAKGFAEHAVQVQSREAIRGGLFPAETLELVRD